MTYDKLGRVTQRTETGLTSTWTYDTATKGIGQLASATGTASSYSRTHTYDTLGRPSTVQLSIDGTPYTYTVTYNSDGGIDTFTYPSGLVLKYVYTSTRNYLSQIKDNSSGTIYWQANTRDAELHALTQTAGNGIVTTQVFDANTGLVQQIRAGVSDSVANFSYSFDTIGNLTSRADTYQGYTEKFCYDVLNRVTNYAIAATCTGTGTKTVAYNDIGNITSKSDVGTYSYPTPGSARPHAISSITGTVNGVVNPSYTYDANGNMTAGAGRTVTWTSFNMADTITQGSSSFAFTYDPEHSRIKQVAPGLTTTYLNALGAMSEKAVGASTTTWHDFIMADGNMVAERFKVVGGSTTMNYFVSDHLGSIASITNDAGTVTERLSYDAWGKRRNANGTDAACGTITSATTRGFTGHEEIDGACLIDANARIYDPTIGRFMSPDTFVGDALNLQDWNAFTYVNNNPLSFTDPTRHDGVGNFGASDATPTYGDKRDLTKNDPTSDLYSDFQLTVDMIKTAVGNLQQAGYSPSGIKVSYNNGVFTIVTHGEWSAPGGGASSSNVGNAPAAKGAQVVAAVAISQSQSLGEGKFLTGSSGDTKNVNSSAAQSDVKGSAVSDKIKVLVLPVPGKKNTVTFQTSRGSAKGGEFVQIIHSYIRNPDGSIRRQKWFSEAFGPVLPGHTRTELSQDKGQDDQFGVGRHQTQSGEFVVNSEVRFYEGLDISKTPGWAAGYEEDAGTLPSKQGDPDLPLDQASEPVVRPEVRIPF